MISEQPVRVKQQGTQPNNFTMIPNIAFQDLKPNAFKLLAVYLDMTQTGEVYAKNGTIAERLGASINTMKSARKELADAGYILYAPGKDGKETTTAKITIQVDWMWKENHKRLSKTDTPDERVSNSDSMVSNSDTPLSNIDTIKQELNKQDPKEQENTLAQSANTPDTASQDTSSQNEKLSSEQHTQFHEVLNKDFNLHGGRVWDIYHQLRGSISEKKNKTERYQYGQLFRDKPVILDELKGFVKWYQDENPNVSLPVAAATLEDWFGKYRKHEAEKAKRPKSLFERKKPCNWDLLVERGQVVELDETA